jgi:hypothetical protein
MNAGYLLKRKAHPGAFADDFPALRIPYRSDGFSPQGLITLVDSVDENIQ